MDIESVGAGASGGFLTTILAFFGINKRFERVDKDFERVNKDIENIQKGTVWRNTCSATHEGVTAELRHIKEQQDKMDKKLDQLIARAK